MTDKRIEAIKEIINLSKRYQISAEEIHLALSKQTDEIKQPRILIYSGTILIFTAIIMLLSNFWSHLPNELKITNDHPVLVLKGNKLKWIKVEDLNIGDKIKSWKGILFDF